MTIAAAEAVQARGLLPQEVQAIDHLVKAEIFFPVALLIIGCLLLLFGFKAYKSVVKCSIALPWGIGSAGCWVRKHRLPR